MNPTKDKLQAGGIVCGQMVLEIFVHGIAPMLAASGAEFVIFDMEHGRCDISLVAEMIALCRGTGVVPIARVPDANSAPLSRVLDLGALGVMVPRVESRAQMEDIVVQLKYPPQGKRGVALGLAHDHFSPEGPSYFADANAQTLVIALLETATAFEHLDEIVSVKGVDVAWMGHYDLTVSMGIPSQFDHPRFLAAMEQLLAACARHHVAPGFLVASPADALFWIRKGFRMISMGSDIGVFMSGVRSFRDAVDQGLKAESKASRRRVIK